MLSDDEILTILRRDPDLDELLTEVCELDITRGDHGETGRLSSGQPLECVAGDFTGGAFYLCGESRPTRPVLYASSEGEAGLVGPSLAGALEVMIGLPSWTDCLKFSGGGDPAAMRSAAEHLRQDELRDSPEIDTHWARLAEALSLDLATVPVLLTRLRDAVAGTTPDYVYRDGTGAEYDPLFGSSVPADCRSWR